MVDRANGSGEDPFEKVGPDKLDPAMADRISKLRMQLKDSFSNVVMALCAMPRYRHQTLADLQHLVMDPLLRDRIAMAYPAKEDDKAQLAGLAIWASVSEEVDEKIREQVKAGVFPIRLKPEDWTSGEINWLLDVVAPNQEVAKSVIQALATQMKTGEMRLHPMISRVIDEETLKLMGAQRQAAARQ